MEHLLIPHRFRGPNSSGNGGWSAGALAARLAPGATTGPLPPIEVTLRMPPPLDRPLTVALDGDSARLSDGADLIATARRLDTTGPAPVAAVPVDQALAARTTYAGLVASPFPQCFTCGPERAEGDGLRLFTGRASTDEGDTRVATDWTPDPSLADHDPMRVSVAATWAALDCPGAWSVDLSERAIVLGRMTASIDALPLIGEQHVVVGDLRGHEGRKWFTATTVHDSDGRVVARAEHTWIEVDPTAFNG